MQPQMAAAQTRPGAPSVPPPAWRSATTAGRAPCRSDGARRQLASGTGSISPGSLFLTLPTRFETGQIVIFSDG
jgi:hypothetical protein